MKRLRCFIFLLPLVAHQIAAQTSPDTTAAPLMRFEVASVKKVASTRDVIPWSIGTRRLGITESGRVDLRCISLMDILTLVFGVEPFQVAGPEWLKTAYFDISAIAPAAAQRDDLPSMLQGLLSERFGMQFHREIQSTSICALVVEPGGAKLRPAIPDDAPDEIGAIDTGKQTDSNGSRTVSARTFFGIYKLTSANGALHYEFPNMSMAHLAQFLTPSGGRGPFDVPVVDMTNLEGRFQVILDMDAGEAHRIVRRPEPSGNGAAPVAPDPGRSLIGASLAKQGLGLVRRSAPLGKIVIDQMERTPTPN